MTRHSRWIALPIVAALVSAPVQRADAQLVSLGVMAGGSLSTFTGNNIQDVKQYAGFIAGAFVRVGALGFAVQPGVYYTTKGVKSADFSATQGSKTSLDYIQIPVVIRLSLPMHLYAGAGLAVGFKLSCKTTQQGTVYAAGQNCTGETGPANAFTAKSAEYSGIAEAGLNFGKFSLGGRADVGISNAIAAVNSSNVEVANFRTRTVSLVAAIRF